jgi:hypothetical protein
MLLYWKEPARQNVYVLADAVSWQKDRGGVANVYAWQGWGFVELE